MTDRKQILIIDDNKEFLADLELLLSSEYDCHLAINAEDGAGILKNTDIDVLLLDVNLGAGTDGLTFLKGIKHNSPYLPVIMITEDERVSTVVTAMQYGASGYVGKKPDLEGLKASVIKALRDAETALDRDLYREEINRQWDNMVGDSGPMTKIKDDIQKAAAVKCNVLITGESGTGKELVARAIHKYSQDASLPFVAVNCAAIPKDLFESELFGHEKGSFTGAVSKKIGRFEQAREGTIFLDEISEIPNDQQAKLLRVLQEKQFYRVGGMKELECHGRVIASSNRDLKKEIENNKFREDLYYRLKVFEIAVPSLRERKTDIRNLIGFFLERKSQEMKRPKPTISEEALTLLTAYHWPGNVRELENCIECSIARCSNDIISIDLLGEYASRNYTDFSSYDAAKKEYLERFQREYITSILRVTDGNVTKAAEKMGVSRQGLIKMMKACDLNKS
ncbi:MAG: sigma-54 dependent transcriptional regulator [candidate division Zixibacteria bacterium]|nr:sigma-54 dependent transcriptional regulator [candidate division Zixibacteria bacterium]